MAKKPVTIPAEEVNREQSVVLRAPTKEYRLQLIRNADGSWSVAYQNGAIGKVNAGGFKTSNTDFATAWAEYHKVAASKLKGEYGVYRGDAEAYTAITADKAERATDFDPMLSNPRPEGWTIPDHWLVQEKHDGERRGAIAKGEQITFANNSGLAVGVQQIIADEVKHLAGVLGDFVLDGEDMGSHIVFFDVISFRGQPYLASFKRRSESLKQISETIAKLGLTRLKVDVPQIFAEFKTTRLPEIIARGGEGYVAKNPSAPYVSGRPASGGDSIKEKFTDSATCRVRHINTQRSVGIEVLDGEIWIDIGNVTIPKNANVPEIGAIIEVKYQHGNPGGSLVQPVYKSRRNDKFAQDCVLSQIKLKGKGAYADL